MTADTKEKKSKEHEMRNRIGSCADRRRDCGRGAGQLQPGIDGSLFQGAEVADVQIAWNDHVCVRKRSRFERLVLLIYRFEYSGLRAPQRAGKNDGCSLWRSGRIAAQRTN